MRRTSRTLGLLLGLVGGLASTPFAVARAQDEAEPSAAPAEEAPANEAVPSEDKAPEALTQFRDVLAPYGRWVDDPRYGTVWVPDPAQVGADFTPYLTAGRWALDPDNRWLWVSDYPWGYVPFHFGRWLWITAVGWSWVPGAEYAPAWVTWSATPDYDYLGWAPLPPSYFWFDAWAVDFAYPLFPGTYFYVPAAVAFHPNVSTVVTRNPEEVHRIAARTRPIAAVRPLRVPIGPSPSRLALPAAAARAVVRAPDERALAFARRTPPAPAERPPSLFTRPSEPGRATPLPSNQRVLQTLPGPRAPAPPPAASMPERVPSHSVPAYVPSSPHGDAPLHFEHAHPATSMPRGNFHASPMPAAPHHMAPSMPAMPAGGGAHHGPR